MAQEYDNNMSGIISKNQNRTQETHADYSGNCEINNEQFYLDGWIKERKDGSGVFLSLRFKPKNANPVAQGQVSTASLGDDDAPF